MKGSQNMRKRSVRRMRMIGWVSVFSDKLRFAPACASIEVVRSLSCEIEPWAWTARRISTRGERMLVCPVSIAPHTYTWERSRRGLP